MPKDEHVRPFLGLPVFLFLAAPLAAAADLTSDAHKALDKYYTVRLGQPFLQLPNDPEPKLSPPLWEAAVKQLASDKVEERRAGAAYLRELLELALEDESSGKAPWRNTPFWGGGADIPARDLRDSVARELAKARSFTEVLPLLKWYLEHEPADAFLAPIVEALSKFDGDDAHALRVELATRPHPNAVATAEAIKQIAARKKTLPADKLAALCHHHRTLVRNAARALNQQQGGNDPGPFDPTQAVRSRPVTQLMDRVLKLMPDLPGAKAAYVNVTVRYLDDKKAERDKDEEQGWLIKNENGAVEIYTALGRIHAFRDKRKTTAWVSEKTGDGGEKSVEVPVVMEVSVTPIGTNDLVKKVGESRKGGDAVNELSEYGATPFEIIVGAWLYRAGIDGGAAKVLLPALDSVYRDEHLALIVREQLGAMLGQKMLVAFVGDRDYPAAIRHAKQINNLYPDTLFHRYAKDLTEQLPKRMDDFTKVKLPTPAEWAELKKKLTRDQQIDFLCERMRLLNCFQMGQPDGYDPGETQYAEPCGLSGNAAWGGRRGKTEVINPLTELIGYQGRIDERKPKRKGLELTVKEVPRLSKYLRDDHYMLIVSFDRDFDHDRSLSSTRPLVADIINGLAKRDLARAYEMDRMTIAEIAAHIQRIIQWGNANADKSEQQLLWEALEEDVKAGVPWGRLENAGPLIELKDTRMLPVLLTYLDKTTDKHDRQSLLDWCFEYDPKDPELLRIRKAFLKPADQIGPLKEWLRTKAKALESPGRDNPKPAKP
jgi:hypothetical protein